MLRDEVGYWGEASDDDPDDGDSMEEPGRKLVDHLLQLHMTNKISASDTCTAMYWASQAGVEQAARFAMAPWLIQRALRQEAERGPGPIFQP